MSVEAVSWAYTSSSEYCTLFERLILNWNRPGGLISDDRRRRRTAFAVGKGK
jgi:hypothetical protein